MNIDLSLLKTSQDKFLEAKENKLNAVNNLRNEKETSGFPYLGKVFDSNERSAARIFGAVQAAQAAISAGQDFSINWTVQDNSVITMNGSETIGMSVAMAQYAGALHIYARQLKDQINSTTSQVELDAIDIYSGW